MYTCEYQGILVQKWEYMQNILVYTVRVFKCCCTLVQRFIFIWTNSCIHPLWIYELECSFGPYKNESLSKCNNAMYMYLLLHFMGILHNIKSYFRWEKAILTCYSEYVWNLCLYLQSISIAIWTQLLTYTLISMVYITGWRLPTEGGGGGNTTSDLLPLVFWCTVHSNCVWLWDCCIHCILSNMTSRTCLCLDYHSAVLTVT